MPLTAEDIIVQVRQRLRSKGIKLWLEPYYFEGIGVIEGQLDDLAKEFGEALGLSSTDCKIALSELQEGALEKLLSRKHSELIGEAVFKARVIKSCSENNDNNFTALELKYSLTALGAEVYEDVSKKLECDENDIKIIVAGKVLQRELTLISQGIKNNTQAIILISKGKITSSSIHERVKKAKDDALLILSSKDQQFMTMEDQDGNMVHLPPSERDSLILALALYEKGRSALKKNQVDEALILFLESDAEFSSSNSEILNKIDNYALLNLDIVWCYLCLKSFSYLPDAEKRLKICEENFHKSYGTDMNRVSHLKGNLIGNEQSLIMRLHLLQGVLYFHQNKRDEAYEKFLAAEDEMSRLQIDEEKLINMMNMGYDLLESRVSLRACNNNIEKAINYISERRQKRNEARKRGHKERDINKDIKRFEGESWINPKSVLTLVEMGFSTEIAAIALRKSKNDLEQAIDLIQKQAGELQAEIPIIEPNINLVNQFRDLGFRQDMVEVALKSFTNNRDEAIEFLLKVHCDDDFKNILNKIDQDTKNTKESIQYKGDIQKDQPGPSTSNAASDIITIVKEKIDREIETKKAYDRFIEDVSITEDEYLDINFAQEQSILNEYKNLLIK